MCPLCHKCLLELFSSVIDVALDLVDHGDNITTSDKIKIFPGIEIGNANGPDHTLAVSFGQGPIHVQSLGVRLMDEQQVDIVGLQPGQRFFDALPGQLIASPRLAQFRRNEDILPTKAAFGHSLADDGFVIVHVGRIDETVADGQGLPDSLLPCISFQHPRTKTNSRHSQAIIQNNVLVHATPPFILQIHKKRNCA